MTINLSSFRRETQKISNVKKCDICEVKVGTLKCSDEESKKHCHLYCALRETHLNSTKNTWKVNFSLCQKENVTLHPEINRQNVIENIKDMCFALKEVQITSGNRLEEETMTEEKSSQKSKSSRTSVDGKKKEKKRSNIKGEFDEMAEKIFEETKKSVESDFNLDNAEEDVEKNKSEDCTKHIGGKIILIHTKENPKKGKEISSQESREGIMEIEEEEDSNFLTQTQEETPSEAAQASFIRDLANVNLHC